MYLKCNKKFKLLVASLAPEKNRILRNEKICTEFGIRKEDEQKRAGVYWFVPSHERAPQIHLQPGVRLYDVKIIGISSTQKQLREDV